MFLFFVMTPLTHSAFLPKGETEAEKVSNEKRSPEFSELLFYG